MKNIINVKNIDIFRNEKTKKIEVLIFNSKDQKYHSVSDKTSYTKDEEIMKYMTNSDYTLLHNRADLSDKAVSLFHKFGDKYFITLSNLLKIEKYDYTWKVEEQKIRQQKFQENLKAFEK